CLQTVLVAQILQRILFESRCCRRTEARVQAILAVPEALEVLANPEDPEDLANRGDLKILEVPGNLEDLTSPGGLEHLVAPEVLAALEAPSVRSCSTLLPSRNFGRYRLPSR